MTEMLAEGIVGYSMSLLTDKSLAMKTTLHQATLRPRLCLHHTLHL